MPLHGGSRLGPYEILTSLGAGGMGEVYKARDTRLDRSVAVKVLPGALAMEPELRDRFDREARAISQLARPHICTLFDVGDHDGHAFLVMELLDGEPLETRLAQGPLPVDQALKIATEIASALDRRRSPEDDRKCSYARFRAPAENGRRPSTAEQRSSGRDGQTERRGPVEPRDVPAEFRRRTAPQHTEEVSSALRSAPETLSQQVQFALPRLLVRRPSRAK